MKKSIKRLICYPYFSVFNTMLILLFLLLFFLNGACKKIKRSQSEIPVPAVARAYAGLQSVDFFAPVRCADPDYFFPGKNIIWNEISFVRWVMPELYYIEQIRDVAQGTGDCNNGLKQGAWVYRYKVRGVDRIAKGSYNNGKKEGEWRYYEASKAETEVRKEVYQAGRLQKQISENDDTTVYTYDKQNRLVQEELLHGDHTHKTIIFYNTQGQVDKMTRDGRVSYVLTYEDDRLSAYFIPQTSPYVYREAKYAYSERGKLKARTFTRKTSVEEATMHIITSNYRWNTQGHLVKTTMVAGGTSPYYSETLYTPYVNGRLEKEEVISYGYDFNINTRAFKKEPLGRTIITYAVNGGEKSFDKFQYKDGQWVPVQNKK